MNSTAIPSTGMRITQILSAPPTQNTAPVHEFRCLYTYDLRRKQKRWQDGLLRFHTFNKRIMVYEAPSRNYIGDKHWREAEDPQDGDELQLEKPVLVQVGEQIGSTETDLTELLEKRRKPQDKLAEDTVSSPRRQVASTAISIGTTTPRQPLGQPSQLQPKTLNALLGTPKGPVGRASLPTKSPHELRRDSENAEWGSDRPAKRQRIDTPPEVTPKPTIRPMSRTLVNEQSCVGGHATIIKPNAAVDRQRRAQHTLFVHETIRKPEPIPRSNPWRTEQDKMSGQSAPLTKVPANKQTTSLEAQSTAESAKRPRMVEKAIPRQGSNERSPSRHINVSRTAINGSPRHSTTTAHRTKNVVEPIEIMSDQATASTGEPPKGRTKLQMASRKPRKKMVFRDLLPQEQPPAKRSSSGETGARRESRERSTSSRPSRNAKTALADFHQEEQDRLADRLNRYHGRTSHRNDDTQSITECRANSPGLFVSQEVLIPSPASQHRTKDRSPEIYASSRNGPSTTNISTSSRHPPSKEVLDQTIPKAAFTVHETALTLSKMDEILFPRSRASHPIEVSRPSHVVEDAFPIHLSSALSIPVTPAKTMLGPTPPKRSPPTTPIPSSPGFQTQSHISLRQPVPKEVTSSKAPFLRRRPPSPKVPSLSAQSSQAPPTKEASPMAPQPKAPPPKVSSSKATASIGRPQKAPSPKPPSAKVLPPKVQPPPEELSPKSTTPKKSSPKGPQAIPPSPRLRFPDPPFPDPTSPNSPTKPPNLQPTTTTITPFLPKSPETSALQFDLRIAQKPLPAFQAPRPKPRPRSPLRKSTSDTTTMRPPPELPNSLVANPRPGMVRGEIRALTNDGTTTPWSKEAWDLFGCGRDGLQCSYEEFKRKEGLD